MPVSRPLLPSELEAALPRANGELVFDAPWQSRAFAMAVALAEDGVYEWNAFRDRLIEEIAAHEPDDGGRYYERWLEAFERVLLEGRVLTSAEVERRAKQVAASDQHHAHDHG